MEQTVITDVNAKVCRDDKGRALVRIGNMGISKGDVVWTDGRCIYGNLMYDSNSPILFPQGDDLPPGVPLNLYSGGLLIYTKGHKLVRVTNSKQRGFANNDKSYSLNSWGALSRGSIADMDIDSRGQTWEITGNAAAFYQESTGSYWIYNGVKKFSLDDTPEIMNVRNLPTRNFPRLIWYVGNKENTVEQVIEGTKIEEGFKSIYHNGQLSNITSVKGCAGKVRSEIQGLLSSVHNSVFNSVVANIQVSLGEVHIDDNGNWCGIVHLTGGGFAYVDYETEILLPSIVLISYFDEKQTHKYIVANGPADRIPHTYTERYVARYYAGYIIKNGSLADEIYHWKAINPTEQYVPLVEKRLTADAFGTKEQQLEFFSFFKSERYPLFPREGETVVNLQRMFEEGYSSCFLPIQDGFYKSVEGGTGATFRVDNSTVYKGSSKLFSYPNANITAVTTLNADKGEYLFRNGSQIFLYSNGNISPVMWQKKNVYVNNWRLRYMSKPQNLLKSEKKIQ